MVGPDYPENPEELDIAMATDGDGLRFGVLGPVQVLANGQSLALGSPGSRGLLFLLILGVNQVVSTERIVAGLWGDHPPATARTIVHGYVSRLRRVLAEADPDGAVARILTSNPGYTFQVDERRIDLTQARQLLAAARGRPAARRARLLRSATALWRGPLPVDPPVSAVIVEVDDLWLVITQERVEAELELGRHAELVGELRGLAHTHPYDEVVVGQLIRALHGSGQRAEALERYEEFRHRVADELGIDPGPRLRQLHGLLLRDELAQPPAPVSGTPVPAQLPPATPAFTGRDQELARLTALLPGHGPLTGHRRLPGDGPLPGEGRPSGEGQLSGDGPVLSDGPSPGRGPLSGDGPLPGHGSISGRGPLAGHGPLPGQGQLPGPGGRDSALPGGGSGTPAGNSGPSSGNPGAPLGGNPGAPRGRGPGATSAGRFAVTPATPGAPHTVTPATEVPTVGPSAGPSSAPSVGRPAVPRGGPNGGSSTGPPSGSSAGSSAVPSAGSGLGRSSGGDSARGVARSAGLDVAFGEGAGVRSGRVSVVAATPTVVVLSGGPGVGKSALAVTWGHRNSAEFPDGVLYAALRGFDSTQPPAAAGEILPRFLLALGVRVEELPADPDEQQALYRSLLASRRVLVVLDGVRDSAHARPLLPGGPGAVVLITSRNRLDGLVAEGARVVRVAPLRDEDAVRVVRQAAFDADVPVNDVEAWQIAALCGNLPLALRVVAARLSAHPTRPVADLVAELADERTRLSALDIEYADTSVRAAFDVSYRGLHPAIGGAFRMLGLAPGPSVDAYAAAALCGTEIAVAARCLRALAEANLMVEIAAGRYAMPDLIRLYARELTVAELSDVDRSAAVERLLRYYLGTADYARRALCPPQDTLDFTGRFSQFRHPDVSTVEQSVAWFDADWPNLLAVQQVAAREGRHLRAWQLGALGATFVLVRPLLPGWAELLDTGVASAKAVGDIAAETTLLLGKAAIDPGGELGQARLALRIATELDDARLIRGALNVVALGLLGNQRYAEALSCANESQRLAVAGGDPVGEGRARHTQAAVHLAEGRWVEAIVAARTAIRLFVANAAPAHELLATITLAQSQLFAQPNAKASSRSGADLYPYMGEDAGAVGNVRSGEEISGENLGGAGAATSGAGAEESSGESSVVGVEFSPDATVARVWELAARFRTQVQPEPLPSLATLVV